MSVNESVKVQAGYIRQCLAHIYLFRASAPMSPAFEAIVAQKALTACLSLAVRLVILSGAWESLNAPISWDCGGFKPETKSGHTREHLQDNGEQGDPLQILSLAPLNDSYMYLL